MAHLLWLDLETTGLDPRKGIILEVAAFLTPLLRPWDHARSAPVVEAVLPVSNGNPHLNQMAPNVRDMHARSGLLALCWDLAVRAPGYPDALEAVERRIVDLLPSPLEDPEAPYLAGASVHFDLGWLRSYMPRLAERLSYRVYDVSSHVLLARSIGMPKPTEIADKPHRALPDLVRAVELARTCERWLCENHQARRS